MDHQSSQVCTFPKPCCSDRKTTTYFACIFFRATRLVTLYFAPKHSMLVKSTITYETEWFSLPCFASGWMIFTKKIMFGRKGRKWNRPSDLMFFFRCSLYRRDGWFIFGYHTFVSGRTVRNGKSQLLEWWHLLKFTAFGVVKTGWNEFSFIAIGRI